MKIPPLKKNIIFPKSNKARGFDILMMFSVLHLNIYQNYHKAERKSLFFHTEKLWIIKKNRGSSINYYTIDNKLLVFILQYDNIITARGKK